jgi:hypothetical protein
MADDAVYRLAQTVRTKLWLETSTNHHDLRRILGHANMLDSLTAELKNLGYELDGDECSEEEEFYDEHAEVAENDSPLDQCRLGDAHLFGENPGSVESPDFPGSDADSDSSDSWESSDSSESSEPDISDDADYEFDFVESPKGGCDDTYFYGKDESITQVTIQEVSEHD